MSIEPAPSSPAVRGRQWIGAACLSAVTYALVAVSAQAPQPGVQSETRGQRTARLAGLLADRRDRQAGAGLDDEAARTSRQLEELARAQIKKCSEYWAGGVQPKLGFSITTGQMIRRMAEMQQAAVLLSDECSWRPDTAPAPVARATAGDPGAPDDDDLPARPSPQSDLLLVDTFAARAPLFVEPLLVTATDEDTSNFMGMMEMGVLPQDKREQVLTALTQANAAAADLVAARAAYEHALTVAQRLEAGAGLELFVLDTLRQIDERLGDRAAALRRIDAQLRIVEERIGPGSTRLCHPLWSSIAIFVADGDHDRALGAATRCADIANRGKTSVTHASALNNLAVARHRAGLRQEALAPYRQSAAIFDATGSAGGIAGAMMVQENTRARVHANLGLLLWELGNPVEAYRHMQAARERLKKEAGSLYSERGVIDSMAKLSIEVDVLLGLERAAPQASADLTPLALPLVLERKGLALEAKADALRGFTADPARLKVYRELLARRSALAQGTLPAADDAARRREALDVERQLRQLEAEARARTMEAARVAASMPDAETVAYNAAVQQALIKRAGRLSTRRDPMDDAAPTVAEMMELQRLAEADIAPKFKAYLERKRRMDLGSRESLLQRIQAKLPVDAALIEIVRFRPFNASAPDNADRFAAARYGAYLVQRTGRSPFIEFGEAAPIDDLVVEFRRSMSLPRGTLARDLGRRFDILVMEPIRARLPGVTQLFVSPEGSFNLVPFGAFVDAQDRHLIETYTFNYLGSGRDLVRDSPGSPAGAGAAVVFADPAFGVDDTPAGDANRPPEPGASRRALGARFDPLPGTAAEARAIKRVVPDATIFEGDRATETMLKAVAAPRILHVATHGFFLQDLEQRAPADAAPEASGDDSMVRSGLVLAAVNTRRSGVDDGVLTALEAAGLELAGTQLVVLSACETGVGDVRAGEGVFGLRRAFTAAGAETLVMSLWQVDDAATQQLMVEFYGRLARGEGRGAALRESALTLLRDPARRHPFYWASFIATGEAGPLRR